MQEIKVKTKRFCLKKGKIYISFELNKTKGIVKRLVLRQRNQVSAREFLFELKTEDAGEFLAYEAVLDVNKCDMVISFWDVVATVEGGGGCSVEGMSAQADKVKSCHTGQAEYDAILGGLSTKLKLKLIMFPRWTKTADNHLIYPFVNGARQFTIQYRKYDKKYDSYAFIAKEYMALLCYFLLKPFWDRKKLWLVCEKFSAMAQDNGLYFFKYCMENLPPQEKKRILYVIDKQAPDYSAVKEYDKNVISFMSFKYMIYLNAAQYLISTDAIRHFYIWDSPNSLYKVLYQARKNIVFLQHGVMGFKQCHRTFHKSGGNRMALFVVSSEYEKNIIKEHFEYDDEEIIVTGLARWDVLDNKADDNRKQILLMPTWRGWLESADDAEFLESEYYHRYSEFLKDKELQNVLEDNNITLNFYIHPKFKEHIGQFSVDNKNICLIPFGSKPLNELLMSCHMLITDYSSVAWDVYYQEKPVVFYSFDFELYNEVQGSYMDLESEAFGDFVTDKDLLMSAIKYYVQNGFKEKEQFAKQRNYLLPYRDDKNSERIYNRIVEAKIQNKLGTRIANKDF